MAIPPEFNFANEAAFTAKFLVPLIQRLGFSLVVNYHGQRERGLDLVFAEVDRFADITYFGLQAKYLESVGKSDALKLVEDCKEAFIHEFVHPHTRLRHRIGRFYVANGGTFSDEGKENFFAGIAVPHGGCVRLLDGKSLLSLDRYAAAFHVSAAGDILRGLILEIDYNSRLLRHVAKAMKEYIDGQLTVPVERFRVLAVGAYLVRPIMHRRSDTAVLEQYWDNASVINKAIDSIIGVGRNEALAKELLPKLGSLERLAIGIKEGASAILQDLEPLISP